MLIHKHHIIPKHDGGTDDPENIKHLSVSEHAEAHRELYEKNGKIEDYLAWKGLSGIIGREEIVEMLMKENGRKVGISMRDQKKGIHNPEYSSSPRHKKICSKNGKISGRKMADSGHCKRVAPLGGGKNLGKNYWYNPETGEETVSFESPGKNWVVGRNMDRINLEFLREKANNIKDSFWIKNNNTGETRMVKNESEIPEGFERGRFFKIENTIDLLNTPEDFHVENVPKVVTNYTFICFNRANLMWELTPKKNSKTIIKISNNDYYGLVWMRDIVIEKYSLSIKKSEFDFNSEESLESCILRLKNWREYIKIRKIVETKKLKKFRKEMYLNKMESLYQDYIFIESIRNKIIPAV